MFEYMVIYGLTGDEVKYFDSRKEAVAFAENYEGEAYAFNDEVGEWFEIFNTFSCFDFEPDCDFDDDTPLSPRMLDYLIKDPKSIEV